MAAISVSSIPEFQQRLLAWFDANARDLPWRRTADAYHIWVSEIMLQQTRVAAVVEHYAHFLSRFPSIVALALAREDEVLALWSGLGYYRRARLLHHAAQFVLREHQGILPGSAEKLRKMPGVGEYTSAAVASIAFGEAVAAVDGNVERVILRIFPPMGPPSAQSARKVSPAQWIREHAGALLDPQRPGDFNQSMMELGATVCLPKRPLCLSCPVQAFCATRGEHPARPRKQMRSRQTAYALVCRKRAGAGQVLLEQRSPSVSLMPGMWELPGMAMQEPELNHAEGRIALTLRHAITVTNYYVRVLRFSEREARLHLAPAAASERKWVASSELGSLPLTGLARKILQRLKIMAVAKIAG